MISCGNIPELPSYGSAACYCNYPTAEQIAAGVVPLDSLPAEWWNALWACNNGSFNCARSAINTLVDEVCNAIVCSGIILNSNCNSQLYQAIKQYGTADQAGAVKSSSTDGKISIDSNGIMSLNGYGNAALQTTAQTLTGAINELKCAIDNFQGVTYSDTVPLVDGTAAAGTSDTAARGDHVHPIGCCIRDSTSGNYILAGYMTNKICTKIDQGDNTVRSCGRKGYNLLMADGCQGYNMLYADGYNQLCTDSVCGYNAIYTTGCCGYNAIYATGCCGFNTMEATSFYGYNAICATGCYGHNAIYADGCHGYNQICATGGCGYNQIYAEGCIGCNQIIASGCLGGNQIIVSGCLGCNQIMARGCSSYNYLYAEGAYSYNAMWATGCCGYNTICARGCNQLTAGCCNIICTEHASCDTYTCISTQGHEANFNAFTCGSSEAHSSHHVTEGQVHVYSCADAVGSEGLHVTCASYTQGCSAYICMGASDSDSSVCVCSHNYNNCAVCHYTNVDTITIGPYTSAGTCICAHIVERLNAWIAPTPNTHIKETSAFCIQLGNSASVTDHLFSGTITGGVVRMGICMSYVQYKYCCLCSAAGSGSCYRIYQNGMGLADSLAHGTCRSSIYLLTAEGNGLVPVCSGNAWCDTGSTVVCGCTASVFYEDVWGIPVFKGIPAAIT